MKPFLKCVVTMAMMAMTGCQAPAMAPPVAPGPPMAALKPLRVLPAEAKRRLLSADPALSRLWGLQVRQAWWEFSFLALGERKDVAPRVTEGQKLVKIKKGRFGARVELGWRYDGTFSGDGAIQHLDQARFLYEVPAGRVLILNRAEFPARIAINGFPLAVGGWERTHQLDTVDYVFGPGEQVLFTFPHRAYTGNDSSQMHDREDARPAALSGMTADPALFGGTLPEGVADEAK